MSKWGFFTGSLGLTEESRNKPTYVTEFFVNFVSSVLPQKPKDFVFLNEFFVRKRNEIIKNHVKDVIFRSCVGILGANFIQRKQ